MCIGAREIDKLRATADRHREVIATLLDRVVRFEKAGVDRRVIDALVEEARVRSNAARQCDDLAWSLEQGKPMAERVR